MRRRRGRYDLSDPAKSGRSYRRYPSGWRRRNESSGIEATLSMKMNVYSEVETEILKDMYSLDRECVLRKKKAFMRKCLCTIRQNVRLRSV